VRLPNPFAAFSQQQQQQAAAAAAAAPGQAPGAGAPIDWGSAFRVAARGYMPQVPEQQVRPPILALHTLLRDESGCH
jgi:hypothetical protein